MCGSKDLKEALLPHLPIYSTCAKLLPICNIVSVERIYIFIFILYFLYFFIFFKKIFGHSYQHPPHVRDKFGNNFFNLI